MVMPGRNWAITGDTRYRYAYQGQENDNEIKGNGNSVNYRYRMHDPRLGRFFCLDPLMRKYPYNSPYAFSENRVIDGLELEGLEYIDWELMNALISAGDTYIAKEDAHWTFEAVIYTMKMCRGAYQSTPQGQVESLVNLFPTILSDAESVAKGDMEMADMVEKYQTGEEDVIFGALKLLRDAASGDPDAIGEVIGSIAHGKALKNVSSQGGSKSNTINSLKVLPEDGMFTKMTKRHDLATKWMKSESKTKYVDLNEQVYTKTFKKDEVLYQFRMKGQEAGDYYVRADDITPEQVGLLSKEYSEVFKVTLTEDTKGLVSTHTKDATYFRDPSVKVVGGGEQVFSPGMKSNATFEKVTP